MTQLLIVFVAILIVVTVSRLITFAVLKWNILPKSTLSNGKRVHHFVYGNILIVMSGFLVIALGIDPSSWWIALLFGVGIGLVLDEFPHWIGNVKELTRNVPIIPGAIPIVIVVELILLLTMILIYIGVLPVPY